MAKIEIRNAYLSTRGNTYLTREDAIVDSLLDSHKWPYKIGENIFVEKDPRQKFHDQVIRAIRGAYLLGLEEGLSKQITAQNILTPPLDISL